MSVGAARFYYLDNFHRALAWLRERYEDLLGPDEIRFAEVFSGLPVNSAALLVRMITRHGDVFRRSRLEYEEIGCIRRAIEPLVAAAFVDPQSPLAWQEVQRLLTKAELAAAFEVPHPWRRARKPQLVQYLQAIQDSTDGVAGWLRRADDAIYRLAVAGLCDRLRILFFGNFRQDWSEFVLTDLGIFRYERIPLAQNARAFQRREEIDQFAALYRCRQLLHADAEPDRALAAMPPALTDCDWIEARRARLMFQIARQFERARRLPEALRAYLSCGYAQAKVRSVRVLEKLDRRSEAWDLLVSLESNAASEATLHECQRIGRRLARKLGHRIEARRAKPAWPTFELRIPASAGRLPVEELAAERLARAHAPVFFVENTLLNSLLGLLCWEAIFAPLAGAFFHEFQAAPADFAAPDFRARREREFAVCFARLASNEYRAHILSVFTQKAGMASPFVAWGALTTQLLTLSLDCIPRAHLRACFERILADIPANRAGLPDLIQFFPEQRRYRLIEVKGPGDRLQANQMRWLGFCASRGIEVAVCKVVPEAGLT